MSEYEYVVFQAVDGPLNDKQLAFAERQSTRAEVTRWRLSVDYHYSSFRGDVDGLLRQGYDVYLQYTNYGSREIRLRFPQGLPFAKKLWEQYVDVDGLAWKRDSKGQGGILSICPFRESSDLEDIWETQESLDAAVQLRDRILKGDLRALYVLWLCAADGEGVVREAAVEPPVPNGITDIGKLGGALFEFFGVDPFLLLAAGQGVDAAPAPAAQDRTSQWVDALDERSAKELLLRLLADETADERRRALAEIRASQTIDAWPTTDKRRTVAELVRVAADLRDNESRQRKQVRKTAAKLETTKPETTKEGKGRGRRKK